MIGRETGKTEPERPGIGTTDGKVTARQETDLLTEGPDQEVARVKRLGQADPQIHAALRTGPVTSGGEMAVAGSKNGTEAFPAGLHHSTAVGVQSPGLGKAEQNRLG